MDHPRSSGILLHVTSLPGPYGIGDLGPAAYQFADWLQQAGQRIWQVLPLVPVGLGNSPYASPSTFAGNPLLVSPDLLLEDGLLTASDLRARPAFGDDKAPFDRVIPFKRSLLERACDRFASGKMRDISQEYRSFRQDNVDWLDDYALFMALKEAHGGLAWTEWPRPLAQRKLVDIESARSKHHRATEQHKFWQFLFFRQWRALKKYCNDRDIRIFGDLPIYVAHDSADVWAHPELFHLDDEGAPACVSGVPPDYFSNTGQRWGNPLYHWDRMKQNDYAWWYRRIRSSLALYDLLRLDHFRGFEAYWEIRADEATAENGRWMPGPGAHFFNVMKQRLGRLPLVAEDLGMITPQVTQLMAEFGLPGMAVLQFGLQADPSSHFLPHNFNQNVIAYTGTHDNDTLVGWWRSQQRRPPEKDARPFTRRYAGLNGRTGAAIHWPLIQTLMGSVADTVIVPLQDVLGLGSDARMNVPGRAENNWTWRCRAGQCSDEAAGRLREMVETYGRAATVAGGGESGPRFENG